MTPAWVAATVLFLAAILLVFWTNRTRGTDYTVCPLQLAAGLPCPLCGGTTATFRLAFGDFAGAWRSNPLVAVAIPLVLAWGALWLGFGIKAETTLPSTAVAILIVLLLALNWLAVLLA